MRMTYSWAAPAMLLALAAGCGHEAAPSGKAPSSTPSKSTTSAATTGDTMVVLKVDGMT